MLRAFAIATLLVAVPAGAVPGGPIDTLEPGNYVCELPGDATGPAGIRMDDESFSIRNSTSYQTARGDGTYLLTSNLLTMTSGPKRGQRFHRISDRFLRLIGPDGKDGALRCIRRVVNNG
jgi:hypothetical protein